MRERLRDDFAAGDKRAVYDLLANAQAMHARLLETSEIYLALQRQAALWRQLGAKVPGDIPLRVMRRLPALHEWEPVEFSSDTEGIEPVLPREPFYWEYLSPDDCQKREKAALEWFDVETRVAKERADCEARIRRLRRQRPLAVLSISSEIREGIAEIVREVVAAELPAAMRALTRKG